MEFFAGPMESDDQNSDYPNISDKLNVTDHSDRGMLSSICEDPDYPNSDYPRLTLGPGETFG